MLGVASVRHLNLDGSILPLRGRVFFWVEGGGWLSSIQFQYIPLADAEKEREREKRKKAKGCIKA